VPPRLARFRPGQFLMLGWDEVGSVLASGHSIAR
jgi:hypothetical protein